MTEDQARERIVLHGRSLFERGFGVGSSGNLSVRLGDRYLMTPTNACLGRLDPKRLSLLDAQGELLDGDQPTKEAFLHLAMYGRRPSDRALVHLHSTYSVAVSCLADVNEADVLPPLTAYYVMRVGRLPLVPFYPPGDKSLAAAVERLADRHHAVLISNHGPVVAGADLDRAVYAIEELEETAKLYLLLRGSATRPLTDAQVADLRERFPS
ncbi:3-oxo-tetronate 4-phosphate decarboxylase [Botrimarina hoheduenensis]|uniref:3-oxo-tetronate 4-phosphate decarboxylase n=1 Tax=Botrimarina hoheduenensis TaxID=2528000 RepID=A0A5C5VWW3_9BACT|nr:3-oxo-tetronate 4-phosphate decarboxylase [Botrimarina hoheduenensis]TWT43108.1 L-fuculose phosphate aldolase [Botrimarina hoheduenensis]